MGLVSQMGRPKQGSLSSYRAEVRETLKRWRREHPGWGAETLRAELQRHPCFAGEKIPSVSGINRFLNEQGFIEKRGKRVDLPVLETETRGLAHDVWQLDAEGYCQIESVGRVSLINLNDRVSHLRLLSYPCFLGKERVERHANVGDYQAALRLAFTQWGLPKVLQVDHDSVFFDNKSKSPFPSLFQLWLLALGIDLTFSRFGRPTDQGMTERSHQLWQKQVIQGQTFADYAALHLALQQRRDFLNEDLPCSSLGHRPPLAAFPQARFSGRPYRPEYEAHLLNLTPVYAYLAQGQWFRQVATNGIISLGGQTYYIGLPWHKQQVEIRFCADTQLFQGYSEAGQLIKQFPWKGDLRQTLLGQVGLVAQLPFFQLHLPFTWEDIRDQHFWHSTLYTTL